MLRKLHCKVTGSVIVVTVFDMLRKLRLGCFLVVVVVVVGTLIMTTTVSWFLSIVDVMIVVCSCR